MITCYDCDEEGRFFDLDDLIKLSMEQQWQAAIGVCPDCGSVRTES